jgi:hypothetical protein
MVFDHTNVNVLEIGVVENKKKELLAFNFGTLNKRNI